MARYIDADKFRQELIDRQITTQFFNPRERHEIGCIIEMLDNAPTADVAPKSEVASMPHKCKDCAGCTQWKCDCSLIEDNAKTEVAREIFEEIEDSIAVHAFTRKSEDYAEGMYDAIEWVDSKIAELKKKYTGEQT
jgi:hypothetical protein